MVNLRRRKGPRQKRKGAGPEEVVDDLEEFFRFFEVFD